MLGVRGSLEVSPSSLELPTASLQKGSRLCQLTLSYLAQGTACCLGGRGSTHSGRPAPVCFIPAVHFRAIQADPLEKLDESLSSQTALAQPTIAIPRTDKMLSWGG